METEVKDKVSSQPPNLDKVLEKINEIARKSAEGDYIYRGESKYHKNVSSTLYREYEKDIEAESFDIAVVHEEILKEAKEYINKTNEVEILAELQHYGGKTNFIDFTTDYLVALFFACNGNPDKLGRVILLPKQSETYEVIPAPRMIPRAGVQKSIFVKSRSGIVEPDTVVCIPVDLKESMLNYLQKHHDISTKTIYNDLLEFIEKRRIHKSAYTEFYKGLTFQVRADSAKTESEKQECYNNAITHYTESINLNPQLTVAYNNRGIAYGKKRELDKAIEDFNTAIALNPKDADPYNNRGNAYGGKGELDKAIEDYNIAIALNPENADPYNNRGTAYGKKRELDKAIEDFNTAIALDPQLTEAHYNRDNAYYQKMRVR